VTDAVLHRAVGIQQLRPAGGYSGCSSIVLDERGKALLISRVSLFKWQANAPSDMRMPEIRIST